jgi:hypothetical protein
MVTTMPVALRHSPGVSRKRVEVADEVADIATLSGRSVSRSIIW